MRKFVLFILTAFVFSACYGPVRFATKTSDYSKSHYIDSLRIARALSIQQNDSTQRFATDLEFTEEELREIILEDQSKPIIDMKEIIARRGIIDTLNSNPTNYEKFLMTVVNYLGTPYKFGGTSRKGIDCSAFTQLIFQESFNIDIPRSTLQQIKTDKKVKVEEKVTVVEQRPKRRRLPDERQSITHKFSIGGHEGYITVGMYEDGTPGEIFIVMSKEGSTISGVMDAFATAISLALQYGVPLKVLVDKFTHTRFEPSGFTNNKQIPIAKSIMDYIFRWLALKFLPDEAINYSSLVETPTTIKETVEQSSIEQPENTEKLSNSIEQTEKMIFVSQADAPPCPECGSIMVRSGSCYKCFECGSTSGCS